MERLQRLEFFFRRRACLGIFCVSAAMAGAEIEDFDSLAASAVELRNRCDAPRDIPARWMQSGVIKGVRNLFRKGTPLSPSSDRCVRQSKIFEMNELCQAVEAGVGHAGPSTDWHARGGAPRGRRALTGN